VQLVKHTADQVRLKVEAEQIFYAVWLICTKAFLWFTHQDVDYPEIVSGTFEIGGKGNCPPGYVPVGRLCELACFLFCYLASSGARHKVITHGSLMACTAFPELLRLFLWWHTNIKSTENSCIPYCCYG